MLASRVNFWLVLRSSSFASCRRLRGVHGLRRERVSDEIGVFPPDSDVVHAAYLSGSASSCMVAWAGIDCS